MLTNEGIRPATLGTRTAGAAALGLVQPTPPATAADEGLFAFGLDTCRIGVWDLDLETRAVTRSLQHDRIFGYGALLTEWTYEMFLQHVLPPDRDNVDAKFQQAVETGGTWDFECRVRRLDGEVRWIWAVGRVHRDESGRARRMAGVVQDITERKVAQERLELLSSTVSTLLITDDPQSVIEQLCRRVQQFLDCAVFFNFLLDRGRNRLIYNACGGVDPRIARKVEDLELQDSLCGTAAGTACRLVAENVQSGDDPRAGLVRSMGVRVYACHPLLGRNKEVIGTLSFGASNRDTFSSEDLELMKAVTDHVAVALLRSQTKRELRESRDKYQALIETTSDFIWEMDALGRYTYCSPHMEKLWGIKPAAMVGRSPFDMLPEEERRSAMESFRTLVQEGKPFQDIETVSRNGTGDLVWVEVNGVPFFGEDGCLQGYRGVTRDITERRKAEQTLKLSEERLAMALKAGQLGFWDWDIPTGRVFFGGGWAEMLGYGAWEIEPHVRSWERLVHPEDIPHVRQVLQAHLEGRTEYYRCEHRLRHKDGSWRWILDQGQVVKRDAEGKPLRALGTHTDITARVNMETALRDSENRLTLAKSAAKLGIHDFNPVTGELHWDARLRELWGLGPADPVNYNVFISGVHPEDRAAVNEAVRRALDPTGAGHCYVEYRVVTCGQTRWIAATGDVTFAQGRAVRLVGTAQDVTELKEFQAELERLVAERTASLQELVGELEHFSYTITHDMRAPLRAMRGFAELVKESFGEAANEQQQFFLGRIITAAERMDLLITDALSYSRAVRNELLLAPVDLGKLLRGMLDTYPEFQAARAEIRIHGELPVVMGNEAGLTQCFSNLLGNAAKFGHPGRVPQIGVRAEENAGWVRIWVEDDGIGIPPTMLPRVFDMFCRGNSPRAGTGIGLALVRKVVDRMGGKVGVESREGEGSRFWVELRPGPAGCDPV